ncbi:MAG TPA: hypothetical protein VFK56_05075 [Mycobacterium sp.]|nr:hypothetical protein [Mycobacterium sp.]
MSDDEGRLGRSGIEPLHRDGRLAEPLATDLSALSPERAATALADRFVRTGYAEARVTDPDAVRRMIRRDCRRRGMKVRTLAAGNVVVAIDEERHARWLTTDEGRDHQARVDAAMIDAMNRLDATLPGSHPSGGSESQPEATVHRLRPDSPET